MNNPYNQHHNAGDNVDSDETEQDVEKDDLITDTDEDLDEPDDGLDTEE